MCSTTLFSVVGANSIFDQLFQSLSKHMLGDSDGHGDFSDDSTSSGSNGGNIAQLRERPVHPSAAQLSHGGIGSGLSTQHHRRLALYQKSLQNHYSNIWNQYRESTRQDMESEQEADADFETSNNRTSQFHQLAGETYEWYMYGYDLDPPEWLITDSESSEWSEATTSAEDGSQGASDSRRENYVEARKSYYQTMTRRHASKGAALPPFPPSKVIANLELLQDMFQRGYDAYMYHGWPVGEVAPLSCRPKEFSLVKVPALTVIDALDTMLLLGNTTEFARAVERLRQLGGQEEKGGASSSKASSSIFNIDQNVSVFETNIRVLGGLLSAHQMAEAWLPQVVVWKQDVFIGETSVKSGRDEPATATCTVDANDVGGPSVVGPCPATEASNYPMACGGDNALGIGGQYSDNAFRRISSLNVWKNATKAKTKLSPSMLWSYDGYLLEMALDIGQRLLPAFNTATGIPYGTVNLQRGVPSGETTVASLAGGGTLVLEFELLGQLTGLPVFGKVAKRAMRALWLRQTMLYLMGKHIDIQSGAWTETLSGIGSNSDSFYEYLAKQFFCFYEDADFWTLFVSVYTGIFVELRRGDWYVDSDMQAGAKAAGRRVLESLMAFYPGLQVLVGEHAPAARSLNAFFMAREYLGFLPERFLFDQWKVDNGAGAGKHPLRPELLESAYLMKQAAPSSSGWMWASDFALEKLAALTPAPCGYASISDTRPHTTGGIHDQEESTGAGNSSSSQQKQQYKRVKRYDEMPSFFLTETIKYLYLTYDRDNILHQDAIHRNWVFTTEAHPIHMPLEVNVEEGLDLMQRLLRERIEKGNMEHSDVGGETQRSRSELWNNQQAFKEFITLTQHVKEKQRERIQENLFWYQRTTRGDSLFQYANVLQRSYDGGRNDAHDIFSPSGLGAGWNLRKACPNIYSSDALFVRAMQGGSIDYMPKFTTVLLSARFDENDDHVPIPSTLEALASWGSDRYPKSQRERIFDFERQEKCPIPIRIEEQSLVSTASQEELQHRHPSQDQSGNPGYTEINTEMGTFQVTAFDQGSGFGVEQVETGQILTATFVQDRVDPSVSFVMVHAVYPFTDTDYQPLPPRMYVHGEWKPIQGFPTPKSNRTVIIADLEGNSFSCDIELVQNRVETNEEVTVISQIPCTTGLFGPAHVAKLVEQEDEDGLVVEGTLFDPESDDLYGCGSSSEAPQGPEDSKGDLPSSSNAGKDDSDSCRNRIIQVVHRGECSFIEKALNQRGKHNADGVIVVNSADEDVFIMSYGSEDAAHLEQDLPVSVLVSGTDGRNLLESVSLMQATKGEDSYILARIAIRRQSTAEESEANRDSNDDSNDDVSNDGDTNDEGSSLTDNRTPRFPLVRASSAILRVFSPGGWGIQALQQFENGQTNWHLQLMRHSLDGFEKSAQEDEEAEVEAPDTDDQRNEKSVEETPGLAESDDS